MGRKKIKVVLNQLKTFYFLACYTLEYMSAHININAEISDGMHTCAHNSGATDRRQPTMHKKPPPYGPECRARETQQKKEGTTTDHPYRGKEAA